MAWPSLEIRGRTKRRHYIYQPHMTNLCQFLNEWASGKQVVHSSNLRSSSRESEEALLSEWPNTLNPGAPDGPGPRYSGEPPAA